MDVGNGTGKITAGALSQVGCSVTSLNPQPDGRFPGRPSAPTAETLETLCDVVAETTADLGVAHDRDADRLMLSTRPAESWLATSCWHYSSNSQQGRETV